MSCLGVHFALSEEEVAKLRSQPDDQSRLEHLQEQIEEDYFANYPDLVVENDKAWDAIHRTLTDGKLGWTNGKYPLSHVILGGEKLYSEQDHIITLKSPKQVEEVAAVLPSISEAEFRRKYFAIDQDYGLPLSEEDYGYAWEYFQSVREFFLNAARQKRYVLFTADQ